MSSCYVCIYVCRKAKWCGLHLMNLTKVRPKVGISSLSKNGALLSNRLGGSNCNEIETHLLFINMWNNSQIWGCRKLLDMATRFVFTFFMISAFFDEEILRRQRKCVCFVWMDWNHQSCQYQHVVMTDGSTNRFS